MLLRLLLTAALLTSFGISLAEEGSSLTREKLLSQMRSRAEQTKVAFAEGVRGPQLARNPVFRYSDQPRRFIDATMWVWTDKGRPVAFQKIEAVDYGDPPRAAALWQTCFASTALDRLVVQWPEKRELRTSEPGITFAKLAGAPAVAEGNPQRKRQARELARKFAGRILTDPRADIAQEMRLLTTPLYEFANEESKEYRGAVYGLSTNGTNPDVLIVLEVRGDKEPAWHFAPARMTCCGASVTFADTKVWQVDWVNGTEAPFATWTFFSSPRPGLTPEDTP